MKLKAFFLGILSIAATQSIQLKVNPTFHIPQGNNQPNGWTEQLTSSGEKGAVKFNCIGLPKQVKQYRNTLYIGEKIPNGNYPITITATDSQGNSATKDVIIVVGSDQLINFPLKNNSSSSSSTTTITINTTSSSSKEPKNQVKPDDDKRLNSLLSVLELSGSKKNQSPQQYNPNTNNPNVNNFNMNNPNMNNPNTNNSNFNNPNTNNPNLNNPYNGNPFNGNNIVPTQNPNSQNPNSQSPNQVSDILKNILNPNQQLPSNPSNGISSLSNPIPTNQVNDLLKTVLNPNSINQQLPNKPSTGISSLSQPLAQPTSRNINDLFSTYGGTVQITSGTPSSPQNLYPTISTSSSSSIINTTKIQTTTIRKRPNLEINSRAPSAPDNIITQNDITRQAIVQRSVAASKAIANLINVVEQARANVNKFKDDIQIYKEQYNKAILHQRQVQVTVETAQNQLKKVKAAIQGATKTIQDIKNKIANLKNQKTTLTSKSQSFSSELSTAQKNLQLLNGQLIKLKNQKAKLQQILKTKNSELNVINMKVGQSQNAINRNSQILSTIFRQKKIAGQNIQDAKAKVADLQAQLAQAKKVLDNANGQLKRLQDLQFNAPVIIAKQTQNLNTRNSQKRVKVSQIKNIQDQIKTIGNTTLPGINDQINKIQAAATIKTNQIKSTSSSLTVDVESPLANLQQQLKDTQADLAFMKNQLSIYETNVMKVYQEGNDVNTFVVDSKENLDAIIQRYNSQYNRLQKIMVDLEKARTQKQIADLAVNQLLAQRTDALPYAIVPLGNLATQTGANLQGYGQSKPFQVKDWAYYLSESYGAAVSKNFKNPVSTLYPFLQKSVIKGSKNIFNEKILKEHGVNSTILSDPESGKGFPCGKNAPIKVMRSSSGTIKEIFENGFKIVDNDGNEQLIRISPCTQAFSNKEDYIPKNSDKIIWKGYFDPTFSQWRASELACLGNY